MRAPDPAFADPRLAVLYDALDGERDDLDVYADIVEEVGARTIVDVGCGTGSLAVRLAAAGIEVVGVDPAAASLTVAAGKAGAERVRWVHGDATALDDLDVAADLVLMTGNVAMVFVDDEDWDRTLGSVNAALRAGGWLVLETRRPEARDWERWDVAPTTVEVPGVGDVVVSREVTDVALPLVTFQASATVRGETVPSRSTLRFRRRTEVEDDLGRHGFEVVDVRDAPDRPGREMVFLARRAS